jgi:(4S)-4-hydroxy-5-phosphonooxypentane-2,3-dione isomerase
MFAAICRFEIRPAHRQAFIQALVEHGRAALPNEPETLRFDVIEDRNDPNCVFLYEAYATTDALQAHVQGPSHQELVKTLMSADWLVTPLDKPPKPPFGPFIVGSGFSLFTSAETA